MKKRDIVIISIIGLNFAWLGWRTFAANHMPIKSVTNVTAKEIIGNTANLSGDPRAKYVIVEFGDYQCPPCARMFAQIEQFMSLNPGNARFQLRHSPLPSHPLAFSAALIAERARKSKSFESVHRALYTLDSNVDEDTLRLLALRHGLPFTSSDSLNKQDKVIKAIIDNDKRTANKIPIAGT